LAKRDPEHPIKSRQYRSFALSMEAGELQSQCGVLQSNGLLTAHQQSHESKDAQQEEWHESDSLA